MGVIQGLQAGAYESLDPPYSIAAGARRDCQDNAVALGLAVDVLVQIAIIASNTGNAEGPRLWAEAHATVLEQDRATQRRDVKVDAAGHAKRPPSRPVWLIAAWMCTLSKGSPMHWPLLPPIPISPL